MYTQLEQKLMKEYYFSKIEIETLRKEDRVCTRHGVFILECVPIGIKRYYFVNGNTHEGVYSSLTDLNAKLGKNFPSLEEIPRVFGVFKYLPDIVQVRRQYMISASSYNKELIRV
jgi:hypothetical protein